MNSAAPTTILIVDDDPTCVDVLIEHLESAGYKTLVAPNGERALQQVERVIPDLVLLDVLMPGIDGFETCVRLKELEAARNVPVLFMTALTELSDKLTGFYVGAVDYITKPIRHEEVLARVNTHVTLHRLQRQLQEQNLTLADQSMQLQAINASKDKFFSIVSHDLKGPFTSLLGLLRFTEQNLENYDLEKIRDILQLLRKSAENFEKLLDNLLTWSRLQRGVLEFLPGRYSLQPLVEYTCAFFQVQAKQKEITLTHEIPDELSIYADRHMVDTILRNLISNALKFTHAGGQIQIEAHSKSSSVELSVSDTGIGIAPEHLSKLFRIDARYKRLGTAYEKGTGLGLILCHELAGKNSGHIRAESTVEKGSRFIVTLPSGEDAA